MTVTIDIPDSSASLTMTQDLIGYLTSKGIEVHRSAGREVSVHCWDCEEGDPKGKGKLYLNTESWLWSCFRCENRGNRKVLLDHFGDIDGLTYADGFDPSRRQRILQACADMAHEMLLGNEKKCQYLLDRGITTDFILSAKIGYVPKNVGIAETLRHTHDFTFKDLISLGLMSPGGREFFNDALVIPYWSHGSVVQLRAKDFGGDGKYRTLANDTARLYNTDSLFAADEILITEGEFDSLAVRSALQGCGDRRLEALAVVGLAGAGSWPDGMVETFARASKVFIGLDPDETGVKFAVKLKDEIGNRARVVQLPPGLPKTDWSNLLSVETLTNPNGGKDWSDIRDLLIEADLLGKRIFSVRDAAQKWKRLKDERPGLKLGWPSIDAILRPGLKPGQLMIPLAGTGCIQGDADIVVNRAGKSFHISLRDLVHMQNGGGRGRGGVKTWDLSIPTMVQREVNGQVRLGRLKNAWFSGTKLTYRVTTKAGRTLRATDEHPFLTDRGWLRLDELDVGDLLHVNAGRGARRGRKKILYAQRSGLTHHPYAGRRGSDTHACRVPLHRCVAEATLNGLTVSDFLTRCRLGPVDGLQFLDPEAWAVHHVDHDPRNNDSSNLKVLTHEDHAALHAAEGTAKQVLEQIGLDPVVSIEFYGWEDTFDLEVEDDPHNFIVNEIVVHNTGKTVFLSNLAHNVRSQGVLYLSLELTASEVFEHFRRIHKFWYPKATAEEMLLDYELIHIVEQNRIASGDLNGYIYEYEQITGQRPGLVIIDYLQYFARSFRGNTAYDRSTDAVMELKAVAKEEMVPIVAPSQVNRTAEAGKPLSLSHARDAGTVEETADFVVSLFRPDLVTAQIDPNSPAVAPTGNFNAQLLKSRHGGVGRTFNLRFSPMSLVIVDQFDRIHSHQVSQEVALANQGRHYDDYRKQIDQDAGQRTINYLGDGRS